MPHVSVLVTGPGYLGAPLVRRLLDEGQSVVALESFYSTPRSDLQPLMGHPRLTMLEGDVASPTDVAEAFRLAANGGGPVRVFHLAAQPSAAVAQRQPDVTERTNLTGARLVLAEAAMRRAPVVFGGSFRVYGDDLAGCVDEATPYGRVADLSHLSKVYVEQLGRMLGGPFVSVRLGVVYGLSPVMKTDPAFMTVPNLFCRRAVRGEPLQVLQDRPVAFVHVQDAVAALLAAASLLERTADPASGTLWRVVNAVGEVRTVGEVAARVQALAQARGLPVRVEGKVGAAGARFSVRSELEEHGFRPARTLADGLAPVLDFFLEREVEA